MSVGGPIESVSIKGRIFAVAADADSNRSLGGFTNEIQPNGDGSGRIIKTRVVWQIDGLVLDIDDTRGDHEFLQDVADSQVFSTMLITYANGESYQGEGTITGDIQVSSASTTASITLQGAGKLTKQ